MPKSLKEITNEKIKSIALITEENEKYKSILDQLRDGPTAFLIRSKLRKIKKKDDEEHLNLIDSFMLDNSRNFIIGNYRDEYFILCQHVTACDYIWFIKDSLLKIFCHSDINIAKDGLESFCNKFGTYVISEKERELIGFICSHGRPAHFFYDSLLGLIECEDTLCKLKNNSSFNYYQIKHNDFLKINKNTFLNIIPSCSAITPEELNKKSEKNFGLFIKLGEFYNTGTEEKIKKINWLDDILKEDYSYSKSLIFRNVKILKNQGFFIIWHGVSSQKRQWYEQAEAIINLANLLDESGKKVCIVIDGWTSPLTASPYDIEESNNDKKIFERIKEKINSSVAVFSTIGETADLKIAIASITDFHITNAGTGSLYVSRIMKKRGILHISNSALKMTEQSLHYNSKFIASDYVYNEIKDYHKRMDFVSYSINTRKLIELCVDEIKNFNTINLIPMRISNILNCKQDGVNYICDNVDPIILFDLSHDDIKDIKSICLELKIKTNLKFENIKPKLYLNYGSGFNENDTILGEYNSNGVVDFLVKDFNEIIDLRFDPFSCKGEFNLIYSFVKMI